MHKPGDGVVDYELFESNESKCLISRQEKWELKQRGKFLFVLFAGERVCVKSPKW